MSGALRAHRAAVAGRLLATAPAIAESLDWQQLGRAPAWLGLPERPLETFKCRVGAVLCGNAIRLWIDRGRLGAAEAALGTGFLKALRAQPDAASIPIGLVSCPEIDSAPLVAPVLRVAGASVLLASMGSGPLRDAVAALLSPVTPSTMAPELAATLVARAEALGAQA